MRIRPAERSDLDAVAHVHREAWLQSHSRFFPEHFLETRTPQYFTDLWKASFDDAEHPVLVLDERGEVGGFVRYGVPNKAAAPNTGELHNLYLMPNLRRRGYGSELLNRAELGLAALGYERARLSVAGKNIEAIEFYRANGWTYDGPEKLWQFEGVELSFRLLTKPFSH